MECPFFAPKSVKWPAGTKSRNLIKRRSRRSVVCRDIWTRVTGKHPLPSRSPWGQADTHRQGHRALSRAVLCLVADGLAPSSQYYMQPD